MTNARHDDTTHPTLITPSPAGEQLSLALAVARATPRPAARPVPAQLRLDARTRQVGRAGIAELRRILAQQAGDAHPTSKAA